MKPRITLKKIAKEFREQLIIGNPTNEDEKALKKLAKQLRGRKVIVKLHLKHTARILSLQRS